MNSHLSPWTPVSGIDAATLEHALRVNFRPGTSWRC